MTIAPPRYSAYKITISIHLGLADYVDSLFVKQTSRCLVPHRKDMSAHVDKIWH